MNAHTNASPVRVVMVLLAALASAGTAPACRHRNGNWSQNDPNGPGSVNGRRQITSGPGIERVEQPGFYGASYGARTEPPGPNPKP
ncbi:MAG TPA: hypothetical protein VE987_09315 [Polyangiaceae bacterium]|nr:hypothetical protein [Polyangiaceae bacterium]